MFIKIDEKITSIAKVAFDRPPAQFLFIQLCPQLGEPMIIRFCWGNGTSPGGRPLLEMAQVGTRTQIYEKEIRANVVVGAAITILLRINRCCA